MSRALPEAAFAAALAALPGIGPATLSRLLSGAAPEEVWERVLGGDIVRPRRRTAAVPAGRDLPLALPGCSTPPPVGPGCAADRDRDRSSWSVHARGYDVDGAWAGITRAGIGITWRAQPDYPRALAGDPEPPGVLFWRGSIGVLEAPCVAVVGTRHCSPEGRRVAFQLGKDLAGHGVCVVSGLALGVDGAAHRGALAGRHAGGALPASGSSAGVAAGGVDVAYPLRHRQLFDDMAAAAVIVSETPPGQPAQAWRFPSRNRVIAALSRMVVVVESFEAGGSMLTVDAALSRGVDVGAVPGSVQSPASAGTNRLLVDGATPIRDAGDVLDWLGIPARGAPGEARRATDGPEVATTPGADPASRALEHPPRLSDLEERVYQAVGWAPTGLGRVVERTGAPVGAVASALAGLQARHLLEGGGTWWVRRGRWG